MGVIVANDPERSDACRTQLLSSLHPEHRQCQSVAEMSGRTMGRMSEAPVTTVHPHGETGPAGSVECWCCDTTDAPDHMVHLGAHPEVHLCLPCAHFVHQRAGEIEDEGRRNPAVVARNGVRNLRAEVIRRQWHENRFIGGALRSLGRHLP